MQAAVGTIPLALTIYALVFGRNPAPGTRAGFPLIQYLSLAGLLVLVFTTLWSYRYTRLAALIADPGRRPDEATVQGTVWTGIKASTVGILFSMIVMFFEVGQLLIYFLRAPQAGIPVVQTTSGGPASWYPQPTSPGSWPSSSQCSSKLPSLPSAFGSCTGRRPLPLNFLMQAAGSAILDHGL